MPKGHTRLAVGMNWRKLCAIIHAILSHIASNAEIGGKLHSDDYLLSHTSRMTSSFRLHNRSMRQAAGMKTSMKKRMTVLDCNVRDRPRASMSSFLHGIRRRATVSSMIYNS